MRLERDLPAGSGVVTRGFLLARFWAATLVAVVSLAASSALVYVVLEAEETRGRYLVVFDRLGDAVTRAQHQLTLLGTSDERVAPNRSDAGAAFADLLTIYSALRASDFDGREVLNPEAEGLDGGIRLARLVAEARIDPFEEARKLQLDVESMPQALEDIWEARDDGDGDRPGVMAGMPLEAAVFAFLQAAEPLTRGEGSFDAAERSAFEDLESLVAQRIRPLLSGISAILDAEFTRVAYLARAFLVGGLALGASAALFNYIAIFRPLTGALLANQAELISRRDEAMAADVAKRNFLSVVSHELRTPMNGVLGFASLLLASDLKPEHRKKVEIIRSSGASLLALVNDILDFSKMEAGVLELEQEDFSIEEVISGVVTLLRGGAVEKRLEMNVRFDPRLPEKSRGDSNRLGQVVTNLVGNAIKFTDEGAIGIDARLVADPRISAAGSVLQLTVSDTGAGVPADKKEVIFERFAQVDRSARRKFEGTGLGLSICKQIVEKMGGRIWVESTPGTGSTFFVRIPLAASVPPGPSVDQRRSAATQAAAEKPAIRDILLPARDDALDAAEAPGARAEYRGSST